MAKRRTYQVKEVATISGVSVRALHHYDEIGLLVPSRRTSAGYRVYGEDDLLRLQQILIGRELGMPLEDIKRSLNDPRFDRRAALERQRGEIVKRAQRAAEMLAAIDAALAVLSEKGERQMEETTKDMSTLFGGFDPSEYEEEVKARWGQTDAYKESARRTRAYSADDWKRYKAEADAIMKHAAKLFRSGAASDGAEASAVVEQHRLSIDRWFYPCPPAMHAALADMYEADPRFAQNIDQHAAGLTTWWSAAIRANARGR